MESLWIVVSLYVLIIQCNYGYADQCDDLVRPTPEELRNTVKVSMKKARLSDGTEVSYPAPEFNHMDQAIKSFAGTFKHVLFLGLWLGGSTLAGPASNYVATFSNILIDVYIRKTGSNKKHVWDQIKDQVDNAITTKLTTEHFDNLKTSFKRFPVLFRRGEDFDQKDLMEVINLKHEVFPQDESLHYSPYWTPTIITWMMHVIAGYLEIRRYNPKGSCQVKPDNGCLGHCALGEELIVIRHEVIQAIQAMYKKRYQSISGIKYEVSGGGGGANANQLSLQFRDETSQLKHPSSISGSSKNAKEIKKNVLDKFLKETHDVVERFWNLYNEYVDRLTKSKLFCGCENIPEKLPKFFSDKYNSHFYGKSESGETACQLPCAKYGSDEDWCPNEYILNKASSEYGKYYSTGTNWGKCTPPDFETLIPTMPTLDSWLDYKELPAAAVGSEPNFSDTDGGTGIESNGKILRYDERNDGVNDDYSTRKNEIAWGPWDKCLTSYVEGFRTKNDFNSYSDNTGITGVELFCHNGQSLKSDVANDGSWSDPVKCEGGYSGARIDSNGQYSTGSGQVPDKLGVVNVVLECKSNSDGEVEDQTIDASGKGAILRKTSHGRMLQCGNHQVICGIRTKKLDPWTGDEAGVVNIEFQCCHFRRNFKL